MKIRIFLADDHRIVREGLRALLEADRRLEVAGEAGNGQEAVELAAAAQPDVVIMDIAMPGLNGIEATRQLHQHCPGILVVILSVHATSEHIYRAFAAGASGYVLKESAGRELLEAIGTVTQGRPFLSDLIKETLPEIMTDIGRDHSPLDRLSHREKEVMQLVVEGHSSADIARQLSLSAKTIETYRSRLMQKLQVRDLPSLVKFAVTHGITPS